MIRLFWRRQPKRKPAAPSAQSLQQQLDDLKAAIARLQRTKEQSIEVHFHIDKVDIHQPTLDQLSFRLDQLDIEQLSGALNIGNNFGVNIGDKKKSAAAKEERIRPGKSAVTQTGKGYSISFPAKEEP